MRYDWIYLTNSPWRLSLTLRYLPKEPFVGLRAMTVGYLSHLDPLGRYLELLETVQRDAPAWLQHRIHIRDFSSLHEHLPPELERYWSVDKRRWSLGVKLLLPYAVNGPFLYTDDDVIVPRDPQALIDQGPFGSKGCFRFGANPRKEHIAQELFDAFWIGTGGSTPPAFYDAHALDAGVFFYTDPIPSHGKNYTWTRALRNFARCPYIGQLTSRNLELRCLDQRFLTMFGLEYGWRQQKIRNGFAPPQALRAKFFDTDFIHYKSSSKAAWMTLLEGHLRDRHLLAERDERARVSGLRVHVATTEGLGVTARSTTAIRPSWSTR